MFPYPEPGWSSMTASVQQKWGQRTSRRDHERCHSFCLALSWDSHPRKPATAFWGSPSHIGEVACRNSSQQPPLRSRATASINCQPRCRWVFRWLQHPHRSSGGQKEQKWLSPPRPSKITNLGEKCMWPVLSWQIPRWSVAQRWIPGRAIFLWMTVLQLRLPMPNF